MSTSAFAEHYQCRSCSHRDLQLIVDLGSQPLANSFLSRDELLQMEPTYPLPLLYCCQLPSRADSAGDKCAGDFQRISLHVVVYAELG